MSPSGLASLANTGDLPETMPQTTLAINALEDELAPAADFCRREGLGLEVTAFAFPAGLDKDFDARVNRHTRAVHGITPVSLHGPFLDLYPASADPAVVAVASRRHERALDAAVALGASVYVAHLSSIPLIRNQRYRDRFVEATADFWKPFAEWAGERGVTIVLENLWEVGPELQQDVIQLTGHPSLKASFDNGHALVFSDRPARAWIETLGSDLRHCHLHDNDGAHDRHWPLAHGREDWNGLFRSLDRHTPQALIVLESDRLGANQESLTAARIYIETARST